MDGPKRCWACGQPEWTQLVKGIGILSRQVWHQHRTLVDVRRLVGEGGSRSALARTAPAGLRCNGFDTCRRARTRRAAMAPGAWCRKAYGGAP